VAKNPTFEVAQIEDFYTLFNLYADTRRQADVREIVTTARTLGYEKTHEFIYAALVNISDALEGEWVGFEQFLTLLTEAIVHILLPRDTPTAKRAEDKPSSWWIAKERSVSPSTD
jgi:Ca2+-binding EF-hand superfamily protein